MAHPFPGIKIERSLSFSMEIDDIVAMIEEIEDSQALLHISQMAQKRADYLVLKSQLKATK